MYRGYVSIKDLLELIEYKCPWHPLEEMTVQELARYVDRASEMTYPYNPADPSGFDIWYHAGRVKHFMNDELDIDPIQYSDVEGCMLAITDYSDST